MQIARLAELDRFVTLDGSEIREVMHENRGPGG